MPNEDIVNANVNSALKAIADRKADCEKNPSGTLCRLPSGV